MKWIDTISGSGAGTRLGTPAYSQLAHSPIRLIGSLVRWLIALQDARMARIELRTMDARMLKDIGLTRGQVEDHLRKHF